MSSNEPRAKHWLVNTVSQKKEYLDEFVEDGVWRLLGPSARNRELVKSMRVGDRIAAKTTFVTKAGVPFDNRGNPVSVMRIKAVGTVLENPGDGESVKVEWENQEPARDWYFFTYIHHVALLERSTGLTPDLIRFVFEGEEQDLDKCLSHPFWHDRYLDKFAWTQFFEDFATTLLSYREDRSGLLQKLVSVDGTTPRFSLIDRFSDGTQGVLRDICPFTTMGVFNRTMTWENRYRIGKALAEVLEVPGAPPKGFTGVPCLNNQNTYFFPFAHDRPDDHIDKLWHVFECGLAFADSEGTQGREEFIRAFDEAKKLKFVHWNLTFGLYWARPWFFVGLDSPNRDFLSNVFRVTLKKVPSGKEYVELLEKLKGYFEMEGSPVDSFPALAMGGDFKPFPPIPMQPESDKVVVMAEYAAQDIMDEGCFLPLGQIERLLKRVKSKKNLILQGPPGTGKTWLARRLGYALVGERDEAKVKSVQFHPNLSYEDFVRGYRPSGEGKLVTADGIFMNMVNTALADPESNYVLVIEEINRGNPAQIFGELLTLLEDSKRHESEAIELTYADQNGERRVYVPENLYVIGTMNLADRSLALVDLALRRRFAFADLKPELGSQWRAWVQAMGLSEQIVEEIARRMSDLNQMIEDDSRLGKQFRVGHSYVTPSEELSQESWTWFQDVVEHEIAPLLEEYWFDSPKDFKAAVERLKQPF